MPRRTSLLVVLALALATIAPTCFATQFTLVNGNFTFTVPNGWPRIMQSPGDPETLVFQAPDSSSTGQESLARVTVTSQHIADIASFEGFVAEATNHDKALPDFHLDTSRSTSTKLYYTATQGSIVQTYVEHFYLHRGYAIQVRCVRPTTSAAGSQWTTHFDQGCATITASLK